MLQPNEHSENQGRLESALPSTTYFDVTRMLHDPYQFPKDWIKELWERDFFDWHAMVPAEQATHLQQLYAEARSQEYLSGSPGTCVGFPLLRWKHEYHPLYLIPVHLTPGQRMDEWRLTRNELDAAYKIINPLFAEDPLWSDRPIPAEWASLEAMVAEAFSAEAPAIAPEALSFAPIDNSSSGAPCLWSAVLLIQKAENSIPQENADARSMVEVMEMLWEALQREKRVAVISTKAPYSHALMQHLKEAGYKSNWMKWTRLYQLPILSGVPKLNTGLFHLQKPKPKAPIRSRILKRFRAAYKPFIASGKEDAWIGTWLQSLDQHADALQSLSTRMDEQQALGSVQPLIREAHQLFPGHDGINNAFQYFSPVYFQHSLPEDRQTVTHLLHQLLEQGREVRASLELALAEFTLHLENTVRIENQERFQALKYCETLAITYQVKFGEQLQSGMWSAMFQSAEQRKMLQDLESAYQLALTPLPHSLATHTVLPFKQLNSTESLLETVTTLMKGWKEVKAQWPHWIQEEKNRLSASSAWDYPAMSQNRKALQAFDAWYQEAQQSQLLSKQHKSQSLTTLNALEQCDRVLLELERIQQLMIHWSAIHPWWAFWHSLDPGARKTLQLFLRYPADQWLNLSAAWTLKRKSFYHQPEVLPDATMWSMEALNLVHAEYNGGVQVANHNNEVHQQALLKRLRKQSQSWPDVNTQEGAIHHLQSSAQLDAFFEAYPIVLFSPATWQRLSKAQQEGFNEVIWYDEEAAAFENGWQEGLTTLQWVKLDAVMDTGANTNIREANALMDALIQDIRKQPMSVPGITVVCTTTEQRDYLSTLVVQTLQRKSLGADALRSIQSRLQVLVWKEWMPGNDSWVYFSAVADTSSAPLLLDSKAGTEQQWLDLVRHARKLSLFTSFEPGVLSQNHSSGVSKCLKALLESNGTDDWKRKFSEWSGISNKESTAWQNRQKVIASFLAQVDVSAYTLHWNYTEPLTGFQLSLMMSHESTRKVVLLDGVLNWGQFLQVQSEERAKRQLEQLGFTLAYFWTKDLFYEKTEWKKEWMSPISTIEIQKSEELSTPFENE